MSHWTAVACPYHAARSAGSVGCRLARDPPNRWNTAVPAWRTDGDGLALEHVSAKDKNRSGPKGWSAVSDCPICLIRTVTVANWPTDKEAGARFTRVSCEPARKMSTVAGGRIRARLPRAEPPSRKLTYVVPSETVPHVDDDGSCACV
jgi:hypothetical protein